MVSYLEFNNWMSGSISSEVRVLAVVVDDEVWKKVLLIGMSNSLGGLGEASIVYY